MRKLWEYDDFIRSIINRLPWDDRWYRFELMEWRDEERQGTDHFFVLGLYDIHDEETITKTCFVPLAKEEWVREALIRNALIHGMRKLHACYVFKRECFKKAQALMPRSCAVGRDGDYANA